jgi:excisionase family DNA binding protein
LTTREVADMFRTTESTVRYWRHTGTGPEGHRYGRKVLYDRRAVDDWVRSRKAHDAARRR